MSTQMDFVVHCGNCQPIWMSWGFFVVVCSHFYLFIYFFVARLIFCMSVVDSLSSQYCLCFIHLISKLSLGLTRTFQVQIGGE